MTHSQDSTNTSTATEAVIKRMKDRKNEYKNVDVHIRRKRFYREMAENREKANAVKVDSGPGPGESNEVKD